MNESMIMPKQQVIAPPMRYELRQFIPSDACEQIEVFTQHDTNVTDYVKQLKERLLQRAKPITFGYIPAPPDVDIIKQVIGSDGYFFKMTTTLSGADFIWHNHTTKMFYFWGPTTFSVVKALNSIRWRIQKFYDAKALEQENDRNMPKLLSKAELTALMANANEVAQANANEVAQANANEVVEANAANEVAQANAVDSEWQIPQPLMRSFSMM